MTIVVGTAGHIDHGKTTLLRALTGIDADRLPEERRRGMTIDVGYAHLDLDGGPTIDFVDVPGHDRLIGNMLVGAGEIDSVLLVVAADDGPRAQTLEHLALLDALGISTGCAVITKVDAVGPARVAEVARQVSDRLAGTSLAGVPVLAASGRTGEGLDAVRDCLRDLAAVAIPVTRPPTLAIDRVFLVKGRGVVVTGTLRGGPLARGDRLRLLPDGDEVRVREIQVHGATVERVAGGGRTALNLAGIESERLRRGQVLTVDPDVVATSRSLVVFRREAADRTRGRVHTGTDAVDAAVGRSGRDALRLADGRPAGILRFAEPVAMRPGDALVLRRGPDATPVGAVVVDPRPARGLSRRRQTPERVAALAAAATAIAATPGVRVTARLDLHGALDTRLAADVAALGAAAVLAAADPEVALEAGRTVAARAIRRVATIRRDDAAVAGTRLVDDLVREGRLIRDGEMLRRPGAAPVAPDPRRAAAMDRLVAALSVPAPPSLGEAARTAGCAPDGVRELERTARIVRIDADLAYAMETYRDLTATALRLADPGPLTPAALRDATGTSRKYVMAILEDLDRRAILRRTPAGHLRGPKAPAAR